MERIPGLLEKYMKGVRKDIRSVLVQYEEHLKGVWKGHRERIGTV
jgi:hypothetical protein